MWREEILPLSLGLIAAALAVAWLTQDPWPREEVPVLTARPPAPDLCNDGSCWQPAQRIGLD